MWFSWTRNPQDIQYKRPRKLGVNHNLLIKPSMILTLLLQNEAETLEICNI